MVLLEERLYSSPQDNIRDLVDAGEVGNEVRLYLNHELMLQDIQDIEQQLVDAGALLREPVAYAARIVAIRYQLPSVTAISELEIAGVLGWQIFGEAETNYIIPAVTAAVIAIAAVGAAKWGKKKLKLKAKGKQAPQGQKEE